MSPHLQSVPHLGTTVLAFTGRPDSHDQLLRRAARRWPTRTAVVAPGGTLTYAELDAAVTSAATALRTAVGDVDRIAVAMGQDLPLFLVPFVASRSGITVLLLNTSAATSAWADQLRRADAAALITDPAHQPAAAQAAHDSGTALLTTADAWTLDGPHATFDPGDPDQTLALIATSGTTGVPKMSRVTTGGLIHAAMGYVEVLGLAQDEVSYLCLPLHYIGPLSAQTTTMPLVGGTNVIPDDTAAVGAARRMAAAGVTYLDAVPAWLGLMARDTAVPVPTWRTLIYGGAPMPADVASTLARRHPDLVLWDVWGLSETHGPATAQRYDPSAPRLPGTVGRPLPGVEIRTDGGPGRPGELLVRGANVTPGYADDPGLTATVIVDGWLRTGDIGTIGPDGTVRLLDRAKDVILRGGANVFSVEVEQVLATHPDVVEAAVFGVPDGLGEEAVAATVVLHDDAILDVMALRTLVDDAVGRHAVPRRITAADTLPRNPTGKIDKMLLRHQAAAAVPATRGRR